MTKKSPNNIFTDFNVLIKSNNSHLTRCFSDLFICVDGQQSASHQTCSVLCTSHTISQPQRTPCHLSSSCYGSGPPKNHREKELYMLLKSCRKMKSFRSKWIFFFLINKPTIWNLWKCQEEFSDRMRMLTNWDIIHFISSISGNLLIKEHVSLGVLRTYWIVMSW